MKITNKTLINRLWDNDNGMVLNPAGIRLDFNMVAPKEKTHVFVLSPEVALAAEKLVRAPTFSFPDTSDWHIPYEQVAIEYPITEEIATHYRMKESGTHPISVIGAHIKEFDGDEKDSGHGFVFTPYWQYRNNQAQFSLFSFMLGTNLDLSGLLPEILVNTKESPIGAITAYVMPTLATATAFKNAGVAPERLEETLNDPNMATHIRESAVEIPILLFACNMLINCKTGVTRKYVPERKTKMSGLGARMRKKMSASAYTVMHLSAMETVEDDGTVKSKLDIAAHYVRGHFKQRKSGVYWWSPFVRGTGELRKRDAYMVEA